ncbi:aminopeptidase P family protein [Gracilibacillus oryzae]|uniref:Aminopeptidase P family protein n=1 Tax=Gracilibacillus oryzae TaxID=1672701 RepID=A0A7C8GRP7_9BACI|nr:Xaa-Pro peptidase family protein [Gracilibacillus oryzae]KAB8128459.1 aminopeptidase P family protein [Gracilibacillus oryzae]
MDRINQLRDLLKEEKVEAMLITSAVNRRYITGFTGTAGAALITPDKAYFITDFRYTEQAKEQVKDFHIIEHKEPIPEVINNLLKENDIHSIGFEKSTLTYEGYEQYRSKIDANFVPVGAIIEKIRLIKTEDEINILKKACNIVDQTFEHILNYIKPGVKEIDVANELEFYMRKLGAQSSSFDIIVASGYRSALPHGVASEKEIKAGELVTMDFGALYQGYCSDITRTVAVGEISDELHNIYDIVLEAQKRGVAGIKPGLTAKEADALTRDYIKSKGYGEYFGHSTGHGLGLEVHEVPGLSFRSDEILKSGMVVTVEPGIYVPETGGCRIEDDIIITENGNERLTHAPKELITIPVS